jgi:hypothetical protein
MMSSKNNGFTVSDIERYHSGKMSPEERHALEKAALDDPFLADALEGYTFTTTPTADLKKIQSRMAEKQNQKKVIPFFQKYKWLSVAALFIIIAGTGWLVYDLSKKEAQPSVAVQKQKEAEQNSNYKLTNQQPSIDSSTSSTTSIDKKLTGKKEAPTPAKEEVKITNNSFTEQTENDLVTNSRNNQFNTYSKDESNSNSDRRSLAPRNDTGGNNRTFNYVPSTEVSRNNTASTVQRANNVTNSNIARLEIINKDATAGKPATSVRNIAQNDSVKHLEIVLEPLSKDSQPAMQEVVVGYGAQKKAMDKYPKVTIDTLEPAEGYVKFDDYVINNLKMPEELQTKTLSGEVQLAFDVDQNGQPVNITVVKSLCEKCDEEAIRLLKEGPKWKKKEKKKGKITIKF